MIFVNLGLKILSFLRLKRSFWSRSLKRSRKKLVLTAAKIMKYLFLWIITQWKHLKVTQILQICFNKFGEYPWNKISLQYKIILLNYFTNPTSLLRTVTRIAGESWSLIYGMMSADIF